jgi:hypothetical protein
LSIKPVEKQVSILEKDDASSIATPIFKNGIFTPGYLYDKTAVVIVCRGDI